jgi:hypothetical protein
LIFTIFSILPSIFPTNTKESLQWKSITAQHALASRVLAVAHTRVEGAWCAYIGAVPGTNHDEEKAIVLRFEDKLREDIALVLFPQLLKIKTIVL